MASLTMWFPALVLGLVAASAAVLPCQAAQRALAADAVGKVYEAKSADGLVYQYHLPKTYRAGSPIDLTLVLHGSNLDRRWGFANHKAGGFRAEDLVVCPDGTTGNGNGGFNFLQAKADLDRLHALHEELKKALPIRATYLYGHSQGSFFALYYAGAFPADVQGVVAQASGMWIGTQLGKKGHHQAIVLMHGTADPVVPYGQSVGALDALRDAKYPLARLRSLEGWNHWPNAGQTEQALAYCQGMTTRDPALLAAAFATVAAVKEGADPVALRDLAVRVGEFQVIDASVRKSAVQAIEAVDACAKEHRDAIAKSAGKKRVLADEAWIGQLPAFLRLFVGTPIGDAVAADWESVLDKQRDAQKRLGPEYWKNSNGKPKEAFVAGVGLLENAFLLDQLVDEAMLKTLADWSADAKQLGLPPQAKKSFDQLLPKLRDGREKGRKALAKVGSRFQ